MNINQTLTGNEAAERNCVGTNVRWVHQLLAEMCAATCCSEGDGVTLLLPLDSFLR